VTGRLVLVATPIGNLGDLSERALSALRDADVIGCEDTRRTGLLLHRHGISAKRMLVVNEHTELDRVPDVLGLLADGSTVALCSDAGSPGISDPGERLVSAALDAGFEVTAVPGPSAVVMALGVSGLPTGRWVFEGFLPRSGAGRAERLAELAGERRTIVLYEAPHRVARTIADLVAACGGERPVVLARELTKLHEDVWRGTLDGASRHLAEREPLGEYVIVLGAGPGGRRRDPRRAARAPGRRPHDALSGRRGRRRAARAEAHGVRPGPRPGGGAARRVTPAAHR
jgi:16S rRNA (cytidine1402-2'-O)-methyltransferase